MPASNNIQNFTDDQKWTVIASRSSARISPSNSPPKQSSIFSRSPIRPGEFARSSHQFRHSTQSRHEDQELEEDRTFKRRFSVEEREYHKVALNKARKQAMTELQLPREWLEDKLDELMYKIDPRTQTPANSFFESFQRLRKFGLEIRNPDQPVVVDNLSDTMMIDGHEFSREHFYRNNYFQSALVDYYWNLLKTERTYHPVKVIYHQKKPHLKIGFKDTRVTNSVVGVGISDERGQLIQTSAGTVIELKPGSTSL